MCASYTVVCTVLLILWCTWLSVCLLMYWCAWICISVYAVACMSVHECVCRCVQWHECIISEHTNCQYVYWSIVVLHCCCRMVVQPCCCKCDGVTLCVSPSIVSTCCVHVSWAICWDNAVSVNAVSRECVKHCATEWSAMSIADCVYETDAMAVYDTWSVHAICDWAPV